MASSHSVGKFPFAPANPSVNANPKNKDTLNLSQFQNLPVDAVNLLKQKPENPTNFIYCIADKNNEKWTFYFSRGYKDNFFTDLLPDQSKFHSIQRFAFRIAYSPAQNLKDKGYFYLIPLPLIKKNLMPSDSQSIVQALSNSYPWFEGIRLYSPSKL